MSVKYKGIAAVAVLALAACAEDRDLPAPVEFQGSKPVETAPPPSGAPAAAPAPVAASSPASQPVEAPVDRAEIEPGVTDSRGVTYYDGYETITAREGDTVDSMARRAGIDGAELAAYNGLSTLYRPLAGDELVLPARAGGYRVAAAQPAAPAPQSFETQGQAAPAAAPASGAQWSPELVTAAITGAPAEPAPANDPNAPALSEPTLDEAVEANAQPRADTQGNTLAPTSLTESAPLPPAPEPQPEPQPEPVFQTAPAQPVAEPAAEPVALTANAAAATSGAQFLRPVDAPISRPFSKRAGPDRNDGVDFASAPDLPVRAAEAGTVVLVSKSLGGLGTILLIRHQGEFLTVYGRIDDVIVNKGDRVERGQVIAKVANLAPPRTPSLHFEIRRGPDSVNPEDYI